MNRTHPPAGSRLATGSAESLYRDEAARSDARAEAAQWLDASCGGRRLPPLLIVIGLGDGLLLDVLEQTHAATKVLAFEPDREVAAAFSARRDWSPWLTSGQLGYLIGPTYEGMDAAWRMFPSTPDAHLLMVHPRLRPDAAAVVDTARAVQKVVFGVRANAEARRRFAPRYLTNVLRNIPAMLRGGDVDALNGAFAGVPAVIAGAGPSLDAHFPQLGDVHQRALFIAVDTALRALRHAGASPQIVVGADPSSENARHFHLLPECSNTWLVAESALAPSAAHAFDERTFWFRLANHHPWPWLRSQGLDIGNVEMWGSVLTAAFQIAWLAGCDPIVMVGSDLAFTGGRPYCRGTTYEFDWAYDVATGATLDEVWASRCAIGESQTVDDLHGATTLSKSHLVSFRDWLLTRALRSGRRVVNASGAGILHGHGIEQAALVDVLGPIRALPSMASIPRGTHVDRTTSIVHAVDKVTRALDDGAAAPLLTEWNDFCGGGLNLDEAAAALAAARQGVKARATRSTAAFEMPWKSLVAHPATRDTLARLPEAAAAFRAALGGEATTKRPADECAVLLADAFELLARVQEASRLESDLVSAIPSKDLGRLPIGPACWWSESLRWAVRAAEGLMSEAWLSRPPVLTDRPFWMPAASSETRSRATSHPFTEHAQAMLATEWLMAVATQGGDAQNANRLSSWWHWIESRLRPDAEAPVAAVDVTVAITARLEHWERALTWTMPVGAHEWLRIRTGAMPASEDVDLGRVECAGLTVAVSMTRVTAVDATPSVRLHSRIVPTQVLTDDGVARSSVAYTTDDGVVCVAPHTTQSFLVRRDGTVVTHLEWPRPIMFELPHGDGGAIAWSNGLSAWPEVAPAYAMYRHSAEGGVTIEELPFRPALGTWWRGRLFFACYPAGVHAWTGIASWAPGSTAAFDFPGIVAIGLHVERDDLIVEPGTIAAQGGFAPQLHSAGWRAASRRRLTRTPQRAEGACSSQATCAGWTASAYPHANLVRFTHADGRSIGLFCESPFRLGWTDGDLVVSTRTRDVLRFDRVIEALADLPADGGVA